MKNSINKKLLAQCQTSKKVSMSKYGMVIGKVKRERDRKSKSKFKYIL